MDPHLRVSDQERDEVVELLHEHRMAGRLDAEEHEERVAEVYGARFGRDLDRALRELPRPEAVTAVAAGPPVFVQARPEAGGAALAFGASALAVLLFTGGFAAILALPLGITGWVLAARSETRRGLRLSVLATALAVLSLVLWVVWAVIGFAVLVV